MYTDTPQLPGLAGRLLKREAARWWWAPLVAGIIWFLIAWLVLRADVTSLATVGVLVGVVLLVAAVTEGALGTIMIGGWKVLHYALAVLLILGALWSFVRPVNTFFALASMLGLLLLLQGFFDIARSLALRDESPYWWLGMVSGGLVVLLALWVSTSDRAWGLAGRAVFILLWVGFMAILRGISDIMLAFELRRLGKARPDNLESVVVGASSPAPAEEPRPQAGLRPDSQTRS
ncbi:DUF308 domain-containing protein [Pseudonocardia sp.]|jgi:uncharacterized membrane protein HdeD (DUF308 family)|uniref:DUF308 domain-containing protein n=1 Tax=Pseudonocardia sp. TaxID=60912 RepID=UPI002633A799|nr:DUF308 domain-containing protein [Pseudonocardia sp.]MCW2720421.1 hypothetical protein [Pseudonocardia sp.]